jgi:predicted RNA-binding Zn ribbon-like protein
MQALPHTFRPGDLVGGHVVLDLVNTVNARDGDPVDWLDSYARVLEWAAFTAQFDESLLAELERINEAEPGAGTLALRRLRELREAIHDVLAATIRNDAAPEKTLRRLEARWKHAVALARLTISDHHTRLELSLESSRLDYISHQLALCAFDLLQTFPQARTRICAGTKCGWLFIDRSKGGQRRWCDMATCGNAAKSKRHHERKRTAFNARSPRL